MKVAIFIATRVAKGKILTDVFLNGQDAEKFLINGFEPLVKQSGGIGQFFDDVISGLFEEIETMEITEVNFNLKTLIAAAESETNEHNAALKPYLCTIECDGKTSIKLEYSEDPQEIDCSKYQAITQAQALLWSMGNNLGE